MQKQDFLNKKYLELCQQLGDAVNKRRQLNDHIDSLQSKIESLNESFAIMAEYEAIKAKEQSHD